MCDCRINLSRRLVFVILSVALMGGVTVYSQEGGDWAKSNIKTLHRVDLSQ